MFLTDIVQDLGAYGLRVYGLGGAERWMQAQAPGAPALEISAVAAPPDRSPSRLTGASADLALLEGARLQARRGEAVIRFSLPTVPTAAELLHPYLAPGAALVWQWAGKEALHAGAVEIGPGAVLVFGAKESGKSTLLAWLAREAGLGVVSDDLAVIDRDRVLAGPRSIDLRSTGAPGAEASSVRGGERTRVTLPSTPSASPIIGSVLLDWGPRLEFATVPPIRRIEILAAQRTYPPLAGDPDALLDLASHPMLTLSRPRELDQLEPTARTLLKRFS
jgi:hypothetical protein